MLNINFLNVTFLKIILIYIVNITFKSTIATMKHKRDKYSNRNENML